LMCSCKGTFGNAIVVTVFTFVAVTAFGLADRDHGLAVFRTVEFKLLVFFHDGPPCFPKSNLLLFFLNPR
jgi:hypothetical protein